VLFNLDLLAALGVIRAHVAGSASAPGRGRDRRAGPAAVDRLVLVDLWALARGGRRRLLGRPAALAVLFAITRREELLMASVTARRVRRTANLRAGAVPRPVPDTDQRHLRRIKAPTLIVTAGRTARSQLLRQVWRSAIQARS
jgi:hypothetical protein